MINIRPATAQDVPQIHSVYYKTFLATYPNPAFGITEDDIHDYFKNDATPEAIQKRQEQINSMNPLKQKYLVAVDNNQIVGVCRLVKRTDHNQLQSIYILPEYQRNGIGQQFWQEALAFFTEPKDVIVQVATYNTPAINFYKKLGFVDTKKILQEERHKMKSGNYIPETELVLRHK